MTEREFLTAVLNANLSEEMNDHATKNIAKLDKRNATPSKAEIAKRAENESIKTKIVETLADGSIKVASEIAAIIDITTAKASSLLRQLSGDGVVTVSEVKVKGKGKVKGYRLSASTDA